MTLSGGGRAAALVSANMEAGSKKGNVGCLWAARSRKLQRDWISRGEYGLYPVYQSDRLLFSYGSREKRWKPSPRTIEFRVLKFPFDLKSLPFGWYVYSGLLVTWEGGADELVCGGVPTPRKSSCKYLPADAHWALGEKLWDEVGTRCIFQIETYINPGPPVVGQGGSICLSVPAVDVAWHLCPQIKNACVLLLWR